MSDTLDTHVPFDAPCTNCGYSLRGLPTDAVCPECAHPVRLSLERRRLGLASAEYLNALTFSSTALLLGLILSTVVGGISALQFTTLSTFRYTLPLAFWPTLELLASVPVALGIWKLTIDDPGLPPHVQARGNARTLRAAALSLPMLHALRVFLATLSLAPTTPATAAMLQLLDLASTAARFMFVFGLWLFIATGLCNLLRWFAARLPDPQLFSRAKTAGRILPFILMPAAIGPAGLIPGAVWMAYLVHSARSKIAQSHPN